MKVADAATGILHLGFNQDHGCFVVGGTHGFRVYSSDRLSEKQRRDLKDGGIGHAEMLFRCNYLALVGGGRPPLFASNKVIIWDDRKVKSVIQLGFKSDVRAVRLRRDRIVVVLDAAVSCYSFMLQPTLLHTIDTAENPLGLCELCADPACAILACPAPERGQVHVVDINGGLKSPVVIAAHKAPLACMALNATGTLLATASAKGTLVRVFDTKSGSRLHELRRGGKDATVQSINFSPDSSMLCVSSDTLTVHIFNLAPPVDHQSVAPKSSFLPKYFNATVSFAKFQVTAPCIVAFTADASAVIAVCADGWHYRCAFNRAGETAVDKVNFWTLPPPPPSAPMTFEPAGFAGDIDTHGAGAGET